MYPGTSKTGMLKPANLPEAPARFHVPQVCLCEFPLFLCPNPNRVVAFLLLFYPDPNPGCETFPVVFPPAPNFGHPRPSAHPARHCQKKGWKARAPAFGFAERGSSWIREKSESGGFWGPRNDFSTFKGGFKDHLWGMPI